MSYRVDLKPLKPYSRSVSIIGVGATPFMFTKDDPELNGIFEGELLAYAAQEAMRDAGVTAADIDFFVHGQAGPGWQSNFGTPAMHVASWVGTRGKPNCHHSEACCTGYVALEQAVNIVASGAYDTVLAGCCDMSYSVANPTAPSFMRRNGTDAMFFETLCSVHQRDYTLFWHCSNELGLEFWLDEYFKENGLTEQEIEDFMVNLSYHSRRAAAIHPLSLKYGESYDDLAKMMKLKDGREFLRSKKFNPILGSKYYRASNMELRCDGAAAVIVCPTELAHKYTDRSAEVLGIGHSCIDLNQPQLEKYATEAAYHQVKELTGLGGKDMDLFMTNDFFNASQLLSAEACEYLPKGEGWKYITEGRAAYDGDRPINPNGGRCHFGHAHGTSGLMDHYEAFRQMFGQAGANQVQNPIKYAMLRGFGGGQNVTCAILKNNAL